MLKMSTIIVSFRRKRRPQGRTIEQYDTANMAMRPYGCQVLSDQCPAYVGIMKQTHASNTNADAAQTNMNIPMVNTTGQSREELDDCVYETPFF